MPKNVPCSLAVNSIHHSRAPGTRNLLSVSGIQRLWTFHFYWITHCVVPASLPRHRAVRVHPCWSLDLCSFPCFGWTASRCVDICLFTYWSGLDIWVVSIFWLLWLQLQGIPVGKCWSEHQSSIFGLDLPWRRIPGHAETLCLTYGRTTKLFHGGRELIF